MQPALTPPLTNVQRELLSLFAKNIPEDHLVELRTTIARFLLEKAMDKADVIWDERGYTAETMQELLQGQSS